MAKLLPLLRTQNLFMKNYDWAWVMQVLCAQRHHKMTDVLYHPTNNYVILRELTAFKSFKDDVLLFYGLLRNVARFQPVTLNILNNLFVFFVVHQVASAFCYHLPIHFIKKTYV